MKEKITNFLKTGILVALLVAGAGVFAQNWVGPESQPTAQPEIYPPLNSGPVDQDKDGAISASFLLADRVEAEQEICLGGSGSDNCVSNWSQVGQLGSPGVVDFEHKSEVGVGTVTLSCSTGYTLLGGGCKMPDGTGAFFKQLSGYPLEDESSYQCDLPEFPNFQVRAEIVCALGL